MALPSRMSRDRFFKCPLRRAFASPGRRRASGSMLRAVPIPTRRASVCAAGSGSERTSSTIRGSSRSCRWGFVSRSRRQGRRPRPAPRMRGIVAQANVCGSPQFGAHSARRTVRPKMASWPETHRQKPERNGRSLARHLSLIGPSASRAHAPSLLAEQRVAEAQSMVRDGGVAGPPRGHCPDRRADEWVPRQRFCNRPRLTYSDRADERVSADRREDKT